MRTGQERAYERMLSVAVAALQEREPERLWPLMASVLPGVCGGEALIYKLDEWNESSGTLGLSPGVAPAFDLLDEDSLGLLRAGYPFAHHYTRGHGHAPVTARQAAGPDWSTSPTARLIHETIDADHVLAVPLPGTTARSRAVSSTVPARTSTMTASASDSACSLSWPRSSSTGNSSHAGARRRGGRCPGLPARTGRRLRSDAARDDRPASARRCPDRRGHGPTARHIGSHGPQAHREDLSQTGHPRPARYGAPCQQLGLLPRSTPPVAKTGRA